MKNLVHTSMLTEQAYADTMQRIHALMKAGEANLSQEELKELAAMAIMAENFEDKNHPLPTS